MPDQDERDDLVSSAKGRGKRPSAALPKLNLCGDIGLKIARDGTWYYQGGPIARKPLVKLFASVLRLEEDGKYYLVTPVEKVTIEVEDLPFVAVEMRREGEGRTQALRFRSNVDDEATAGPEHALGFEPGPNGRFTPYVVMRRGLKARLARPVYYELAALAVEGPGSQGLGVWSGGKFFPFPPAERESGN
ncbi:MAG TPA: DUF1285 domain-containing protein [Methyloceanibacter sp.]|jgi:hypothetical protein|nr:DUF1285 domain-containing protein [Methyloceanibacter sp.]